MVSRFFFVPKAMFSLIFSLTAQKTRTSAGTGPLKTRLFLCCVISIAESDEKINRKVLFSLQILNVLLHSVGTGLLHLICRMRVHVQGKRCRRMAEVFLNRFDIVAIFDRGNSVAMTKIMEAHGLHADCIADPFEAVINSAV